MEAQEAKVESNVNVEATAAVEAKVEERVEAREEAQVDDREDDYEGCRAEVSSKRDMPKFQVVAKKGLQTLFWTFDGRRELDTALAENDYDDILKIYRGKEIPFKMKKGISLS